MSILEGISFIFLLLTLVVYICLPVLQNLHGKTLMSHAASLMVGYFWLCILPWVKDIQQNNRVFCSASGAYLLIYLFLNQIKGAQNWIWKKLKVSIRMKLTILTIRITKEIITCTRETYVQKYLKKSYKSPFIILKK